MVRQLASRPTKAFDVYGLLGALEHLEDMARRTNHPDFRRYMAILSQCKKLPPSPRLEDMVTQLLGDATEREVAKAA